MTPTRQERKLVYTNPHCKRVFSDFNNAKLRKQKPIRALVTSHCLSVHPFSPHKLVQILQSLLRDSIFESQTAADLAFPELAKPTKILDAPLLVHTAMDSSDSTQSGTHAHLRRLFVTGDGSDLTVLTSSRHYDLHHLHVCLRSPVFLASCQFKTGHQPASDTKLGSATQITAACGGSLDLSPDDQDPHAVNCLLQFLYLDNYDETSYYSDEESFKDCLDNGTKLHPLLLHARVSALADCYNIPELKKLAFVKFQAAAPPKNTSIEDIAGFVLVIREVYASTKDSDLELRTVVARVFHEHDEQLLRLEDIDNLLLEYAALGRDVLKQKALKFWVFG